MNHPKPPKWITRLIDWYCHPDYSKEITGDLQEMFAQWSEKKSPFRAKTLYALNALLFVRAYNNRFLHNSSKPNLITMIQHAIKLSLRNIRKHKVYSIGNVLGLAIGISIGLMIFLHIDQELSYEKNYPKHEKIFRVSSHNEWAKSPPSMAEEMQKFFPEVEKTTRFAKYGGNASMIGKGENQFISQEVFQTDQSSVDIFDLKFIYGNSSTALERPYTVLINSTIANRVFGDQNPVGETIEINEENRKFEITGVIEDLPSNSHIKAEVLVSMATFYDQIPDSWTSSRGWMVMYTYALLSSPENVSGLRERMPDFARNYLHEQTAKDMEATGNYFEIMPLTDIHLKSNKSQEMRANSDTAYIYIFASLAIFILIIASVNFINIFTTLSLKRVKEVGLRKVVGARKKQLILLLLTEACVTSIIAAILGLGICLLSISFYNNLADLALSFSDLLKLQNLILIFGSSIGIGLISGLYPSFLVARQKLTESILSNVNPKMGISLFRKGLIVFQFGLSLFILIATMVVNKQMDFIRNKDLGYSTDQLVTIKTYGNLGREIRKDYKNFSTILRENPNVKEVSMVSNLMGEPFSVEYFTPAGADPETDFGGTNMIWTDENYLKTMDIELIQGRNFRAKTDTSITFLVSEQLAKNWKMDVVGTMAEFRGDKGQIVGVFKDINYYSLHNQIEPLAICLRPSWAGNLLFKIREENMPETIDFIESKLKEKSPTAVAQFSFVSDRLQQLYKSENSMFAAFRLFSLIALVVSCLGLLGIAAIEVQRRTKEVGIRKVLGASGREVLLLLSKQFVLMLGIAALIAIPTSYLSAKEWLNNYSYSIALSSWEFILPSLGLAVISLLVVSLHSVKVMRENPTKSLRTE